MIVINKKRLTIIISLVAISTFTFLIFHNEKGIQYGSETIPTVALPVTNKVIVVDAGHRHTR